jgi:prepilin-type N-terminal cleavage/methylation domain-containing protein
MDIQKNKKRAFTLIELLVVVAIISMLTSITLASLGDARQKGRDAGRIRALQEVRSALQLYATDNGGFPIDTQTNLTTTLVNGPKKYISKIDSSIKYQGTNMDVTATCNTGASCASYHLGIILERRDNRVLKSDKDLSEGVIYGKTDTCLTGTDTSASPELCYDITP